MPLPIPTRVKLIFGIFLIFIGLISALGGDQIQKIKNAHASINWASIEGKILSSEIKSKTNTTRSSGKRRRSTSYFANILYEYEIKGEKYTGKKISYGDYGSSDYDSVKTIVANYPRDKKVDVFYNTINPKEAVLEPGAPLSTYVPAAIGIIMIFAGGGLLFSLLKKKDKENI